MNIADLVMERITEWKKIDRILNKTVPLSAEKGDLLKRYTDELLNHKPVQYVLQEAWFFGMTLYVDENVLIPRPETEELVRWAVQEISRPQTISVLDVGSGSGCIAIALKKKLPAARIFSCDVSKAALEVAGRNAEANQTDINFIECDFLNANDRATLPRVNYIVSNPPYVPMHDKATMSLQVLTFEPHLALFVEDNDAFVFYNAIADFAKTHLEPNGQVFVEVHEDLGEQVAKVFAKDFSEVELQKDMQGKNRLLKAGAMFQDNPLNTFQ